MHVYRTIWEDAAKRRDIELAIDYTVTAGVLTMGDIRPVKVRLHADSRVLPCTRPVGQRLLTQAFLDGRDGATRLEDEILAYHQLMDEGTPTVAMA